MASRSDAYRLYSSGDRASEAAPPLFATLVNLLQNTVEMQQLKCQQTRALLLLVNAWPCLTLSVDEPGRAETERNDRNSFNDFVEHCVCQVCANM